MEQEYIKSILITGAASGIGAATVKKIAKKNVSLTLTTKSNSEALEEIVDDARQKGSFVNYICGDLSDKNFIKKLVALGKVKTGVIDQFVANAGYAEKKQFGNFNRLELIKSIETMSLSFADIINLCINDFKSSRCGRVVSVSSFVNKNIGLNNTIFPITAAAKGALEALTKTLSFQLAKYQVTVNSVSPGYTKKDGNHSALSDKEWNEIISKIPLERLAKPQDSANLIAFLLSEEASYITGQIINVDGGLSII